MTVPWTQSEIDMVRSLDGQGTPAGEIARRLPGRTQKAVVEKLSLLGLRTGVTPVRPPMSVDFTVRPWPSMTKQQQYQMRRRMHL